MNAASGPTLLGFDVILVASLLAGVAAFAVLFAIYTAITIKDPMAKRVKALEGRREELKMGLVTSSAKKRQSLVRKNDTADKVRDTLGNMKVLQQSQVETMQQKLAWAGYRNKEIAVILLGVRMVAPIILGLVTFVLLWVVEIYPDWELKKVAALAVTMLIGYKGPEVALSNTAKKRTDAIRKGLPDALDLLVICAEAGLTVDAAFNRVAKELGRAYPELGDEFALTAIELSFLNERKKAFDNLAYRVNLEAVKGVVTTMVQTERYGTPLASALRVLSAEFRNERMMRAEEKAARLPAIMTVPLILFILPVLFIVILGPAACSISDAFSGGIG